MPLILVGDMTDLMVNQSTASREIWQAGQFESVWMITENKSMST
jgi:hypothetical protein